LFLLLLGGVIGLFMSMVLFSLLSVFEQSINVGVLTNIIIAIATVVATAIHFDSQRKLRKDRIWDINKDLLLDLVYLLDGAIKATRAEIHNSHIHHSESEIKVDWSVSKNLDKKISYALNVYKPLMDEKLISSISSFKQVDNRIEREVLEEDLDHFDAYTQLLSEYESLYENLQQFIVDLSGIKQY